MLNIQQTFWEGEIFKPHVGVSKVVSILRGKWFFGKKGEVENGSSTIATLAKKIWLCNKRNKKNCSNRIRNSAGIWKPKLTLERVPCSISIFRITKVDPTKQFLFQVDPRHFFFFIGNFFLQFEMHFFLSGTRRTFSYLVGKRFSVFFFSINRSQSLFTMSNRTVD